MLQYNGEFSANFFNFLLFISYWISPFVGVVLADWWLRGRRADANSVVDYAKLPTGTIGLVALVVGFAAGIPFEASSLGYSWGGPFNYITANYLHGADLAYYVGGAVAFLIYWFAARSSVSEPELTPLKGPGGHPSGPSSCLVRQVHHRLKGQGCDVGGDLVGGGDPQAVDRPCPLHQRLERNRARRPPRHERVVGQHEQPALGDQRLELERPAREHVGGAGNHA